MLFTQGATGDLTPHSGTNLTFNSSTGALTASSFVGDLPIANGANNRIVTTTGSASITGESNLTFDGDGLLTMTSASGACEFTLVGPSDTDSGIYFNDGSNVGALSYQHSDNSMRFRVNSTEKLRIDSSGRLLLGTTTEGVAGADEFTIGDSGDTGMTIRSGTSSSGGLYFSDGTSGADEYRGVVNYNHTNNYMGLYTDGSETVSYTHLTLPTIYSV